MAWYDESPNEPSTEPPPVNDTVKSLLTIWCILLVLGALPALMLTGMAFEGGYTFGAIYSVTLVWLYPILVGVAYASRRSKPALAWLPLIPVALILLSMATN
jgi:hypothetical protein